MLNNIPAELPKLPNIGSAPKFPNPNGGNGGIADNLPSIFGPTPKMPQMPVFPENTPSENNDYTLPYVIGKDDSQDAEATTLPYVIPQGNDAEAEVPEAHTLPYIINEMPTFEISDEGVPEINLPEGLDIGNIGSTLLGAVKKFLC